MSVTRACVRRLQPSMTMAWKGHRRLERTQFTPLTTAFIQPSMKGCVKPKKAILSPFVSPSPCGGRQYSKQVEGTQNIRVPDALSADNRREHYSYSIQIPTRWKDNDAYKHVNNVTYYEFMDTVVNFFLIKHGGLNYDSGDVAGFIVESQCRFHHPISFPELVLACLRIGHVGQRSVKYEIGLYSGPNIDEIDPEPRANGWFVHVFVDSKTSIPTRVPLKMMRSFEYLQRELKEKLINPEGVNLQKSDKIEEETEATLSKL